MDKREEPSEVSLLRRHVLSANAMAEVLWQLTQGFGLKEKEEGKGSNEMSRSYPDKVCENCEHWARYFNKSQLGECRADSPKDSDTSIEVPYDYWCGAFTPTQEMLRKMMQGYEEKYAGVEIGVAPPPVPGEHFDPLMEDLGDR